VHPEVQLAMKELGVDLSQVKPQKLTDELAGGAQLLVTMGCGEACPYIPGLEREDWPLEDPRENPSNASEKFGTKSLSACSTC